MSDRTLCIRVHGIHTEEDEDNLIYKMNDNILDNHMAADIISIENSDESTLDICVKDYSFEYENSPRDLVEIIMEGVKNEYELLKAE